MSKNLKCIACDQMASGRRLPYKMPRKMIFEREMYGSFTSNWKFCLTCKCWFKDTITTEIPLTDQQNKANGARAILVRSNEYESQFSTKQNISPCIDCSRLHECPLFGSDLFDCNLEHSDYCFDRQTHPYFMSYIHNREPIQPIPQEWHELTSMRQETKDKKLNIEITKQQIRKLKLRRMLATIPKENIISYSL